MCYNINSYQIQRKDRHNMKNNKVFRKFAVMLLSATIFSANPVATMQPDFVYAATANTVSSPDTVKLSKISAPVLHFQNLLYLSHNISLLHNIFSLRIRRHTNDLSVSNCIRKYWC